GVADEDEIAQGALDANGNGTIDACEPVVLSLIDTVPVTSVNWMDSLNFPAFDPAWGVLQSADITLTVTGSSSCDVENLDVKASAFDLTTSIAFQLERPGGGAALLFGSLAETTLGFLPPFDGLADLMGASAQNVSFTDLPETVQLNIPSSSVDLDLFVGAPGVPTTLDLPLQTFGVSTASGPGNLIFLCQNEASALAALDYTILPGGEDCDNNGMDDQLEIFQGALDLNDNGVLDKCEDFVDFCFGDESDLMGCTPCPCANTSAPGTIGGGLNGEGRSARLIASGEPDASNDTWRFEVTGAASFTFAFLGSGLNALPNMGPCPRGSGIQSSSLDGLRCMGGMALRHGARSTSFNGDIGTGLAGPGENGWGAPDGPTGGLIAANAFVIGQTRHFMVTYRTDQNFGCFTGLNTTNGVSVTIR
ncbi:MAG: choice-of-anchor E domain-containing protein, partial [Planctomycetota bacterium]